MRVLEPRSAKGEAELDDIFCLPADFGWNDLGSWTRSARTSHREEHAAARAI